MYSMKKLFLFALLVAFAAAAPSASAEEGRLLRFPDVYGNQVAFVSAGDIWIASTEGGPARRLTSDEGLELFPKFSPDGRYIAFTGEYDGNRDVYVMPATGGEPRRLTWSPDMQAGVAERMGPDNIVMGWTPDGRNVLYRSRKESFAPLAARLMLVSVDGGLPKPLAVPRGGYTTFSADGSQIAYNRIFREFRTWKRYRGGQADDVWIYDLKSGAIQNLTNNPAADTFPMWAGDKVYFRSDRDGRANLYVVDLKTKQTAKATDHADFDVMYPSLGKGAIAYENGGYIYLFDLSTQKSRKLTIELNDDRKLVRPEFVSPTDAVQEWVVAPGGKRAAFIARGDVFSIPAEKGPTRNLTNSPGARERGVQWSPDGKYISYLSDATGEYEIYIAPQDGSAPPTQITTGGNVLRFLPIWSPDSKKLVFGDRTFTLSYVDVDTKQVVKIDKSNVNEINSYTWSPDSRWVAYQMQEDNGFTTIRMYSLATAKSTPVTSDFTNSYSPAFDPDGKYLYFSSDRALNASLGSFELSYAYERTSQILCLTLAANTPSPLAPESDEVAAEAKPESKAEADKTPKPVETKVDLDGIQNRVVALVTNPGNYGGLQGGKGVLFYQAFPSFALTGAPPEQTKLRAYDLAKRKDVELGQFDNYDISPDKTKLILLSGSNYTIVDAKADAIRPGEGQTLNLSGMQMKVDRRAEWKQMFYEAARIERDYFYAPNMHGLNWNAVRDRYAAMLPYVAHRFDLTYLIGEMIGELNTSHAYTGGGDLPNVKHVRFGLLGVDFEEANGYYRFKNILQGENWDEDHRSPLTEPGVDVKPGEYLLAVDGVELRSPTNPYALFENKAGVAVTLKVNSTPTLAGAREVTVRTLTSESQLRYFNWVERNRRYVEEKTGGRVGYVHIPNMGGEGLNEFVKYYYPQIRKDGLIVDVRYNGGGFVSQMILDRLRRTLSAMDAPRNGQPTTYPAAVFTGPMTCLLNELSSSDGDQFPIAFKQYGLGKLIGKRSWGGVTGIRGYINLMDGGYVTAPEFGSFSLDSQWMVEGYGVDPDIEVDNLPMDELNGKDAQLDRAIEQVTIEMKSRPARLPARPADPVKK